MYDGFFLPLTLGSYAATSIISVLDCLQYFRNSMKPFLTKHHRILFYLTWLILGIIQASYTELIDDEAYYWIYSIYPDWGYFDHPPMIAMLIKMGYFFFKNELGVRLLPLLMSLGTLLIIEKLIDNKKPFLFYTIACSIAILQLNGFIAVPDAPLIFLTALFFLCYKRFTQNTSILNSILLGAVIAMLLYTKYHAVLIVAFTILSNLKLLKRYQTWLAAIIALALFTPHLLWQYNHDWISFRYHLFESNVQQYKLSYTLDYIAGQILLAGPIAGFIILPAAILIRPTNLTERAMKFTMIGIYLFFLASSFKGQTEANWTSPILAPLAVLSYAWIAQKPKWNKALLITLPITIVIVLAARIAMIADIIPLRFIRERFHSWKEWPAEMKERTKGLPVVFYNSYQRASKYRFYTGQLTHCLNENKNRRNNFDFWPTEDSVLGKPVFVADIYNMPFFTDSIKTPMGWLGFKVDSNYVSFTKVQLIPVDDEFQIKKGDSLQIDMKIDFPQHHLFFSKINFGSLNDRLVDSLDNVNYGGFKPIGKIFGPSISSATTMGVFDKYGKPVKEITLPYSLEHLMNNDSISFTLKPVLEKGEYLLRFSIKANDQLGTRNSPNIKLTVE